MNLSFPCQNRSRDLPVEQVRLARFICDLNEGPDIGISYGIGNGSNQDGASWDREEYLDYAANMGLMPVS